MHRAAVVKIMYSAVSALFAQATTGPHLAIGNSAESITVDAAPKIRAGGCGHEH